MAQGERTRHHRQSSKIFKSISSDDESDTEHKLASKRKPNDEVTINYIKRILCADSVQSRQIGKLSNGNIDSTPLHELLPPLTSSNDVDIQMYAVIAVILSQFVQSWYNRITPDQEFVKEVVQIIAHTTRGLEERVRHVDLQELLLDELPGLLVTHVDGMHLGSSIKREVATNNFSCPGSTRRVLRQ